MTEPSVPALGISVSHQVRPTYILSVSASSQTLTEMVNTVINNNNQTISVHSQGEYGDTYIAGRPSM